jgi:subtilisin family serine protease/PKD repeat protein
MRDGRKVPLVKSESELGIVFERGVSVPAVKARLAGKGRGVIEDIEGAPDSRVKLLRVPDVRAVRREVMKKDASVEDVRPIYRFSGVQSPAVSTGTIVVKVRRGLSEADLGRLWADYEITDVTKIDGLSGVYRVVPANEDEVFVAEHMAFDQRTRWAQPNLRRVPQRRQATPDPDDQYFSQQWHLENTGQLGGTLDADIDAPEAWLVGEGQDILIGMFDDACDVDHEDLFQNYLGVGHDPSLDSRDPGFEDPRPKQIFDRHGTAVMGLAVARANTLGVRGVAYLSRFTVSRGLGELLTDEEIARVYTFARQQEVDVHINSWGINGPNPAVIEDAIETAFSEGRDLDGDDGDNPPLGMVIVFASGNDGIENQLGFELSTMPEVLGVGASTFSDRRASFSNFSAELDFLTPGAEETSGGIATTDNEDSTNAIELGYNIGGVSEDPVSGLFLIPDLDNQGRYTNSFGGTSASAPIAAGVAALILSVNRQLTATEVRIIMEHTCDKINPSDAAYNQITGRSLQYGFGRINAERAVRAAEDTLGNGGFAWPDVASDVSVEGTFLRWTAGVGSDEFLVVESSGDFGFIPDDGVCYSSSQRGCGAATIANLPTGVSVTYVGCDGDCEAGSEQSAAFTDVEGVTKLFAIYGRSAIGRYSHGITIDSEGGGQGGGGAGGMLKPKPAVTISAAPLEGVSPLTVNFRGNAVSELDIDGSKTRWDFDIDSTTDAEATTTSASYTYEVLPGEIRIFTAQLTMVDVAGTAGTATVNIRVVGEDASDDGGLGGANNIRVVISLPDTAGSDVSEGVSPFDVVLAIDADTPITVQSVVWDLGDGTRATSRSVLHTYINEGDTSLVLPITATVTAVTSGGSTVTTRASRLITVFPGSSGGGGVTPGPIPGTIPDGEGGAVCGTAGMVPLMAIMMTLTMWVLRRR